MIASTQTNHPLAGSQSEADGQTPITLACAQLKQAGLRITQPRIAILSALIKRGQPTSIEQIHGDLASGSCDLVTVYRCLSAFENLGLVRRSYLHNGTCLYELTIGNQNHYHIVCKSCGQTERVDYFSVEGMERTLQERGYAEVSHVVGFYGICPSCQKTATSRVATPAAASRTGTPATAPAASPAAVPTRAGSPAIPSEERIKL